MAQGKREKEREAEVTGQFTWNRHYVYRKQRVLKSTEGKPLLRKDQQSFCKRKILLLQPPGILEDCQQYLDLVGIIYILDLPNGFGQSPSAAAPE